MLGILDVEPPANVLLDMGRGCGHASTGSCGADRNNCRDVPHPLIRGWTGGFYWISVAATESAELPEEKPHRSLSRKIGSCFLRTCYWKHPASRTVPTVGGRCSLLLLLFLTAFESTVRALLRALFLSISTHRPQPVFICFRNRPPCARMLSTISTVTNLLS